MNMQNCFYLRIKYSINNFHIHDIDRYDVVVTVIIKIEMFQNDRIESCSCYWFCLDTTSIECYEFYRKSSKKQIR